MLSEQRIESAAGSHFDTMLQHGGWCLQIDAFSHV